MADLGLSAQPRDHARYIANWLKSLKDDKRAIFTAGPARRPAVPSMGNARKAPLPFPEQWGALQFT